MSQSLHEVKVDPRNVDILISINGTLFPRHQAMVSVFDSGFILGDGVWEGLRLVNGGVPFLHAHIERLYEGAKAIFMDVGVTPQELVQRLFACIDANKMHDGVHVRLMVTLYVANQRLDGVQPRIDLIQSIQERPCFLIRDSTSFHRVPLRSKSRCEQSER